jgi:hypothetical protein
MDFTDLSSLFQQNRQIIIIFGLVIAGTMVFNIIRFKSMKKSNTKFLEEHPDAVRVYLSLKALAAFGTVAVHSVDGDAPAFFSENLKSGFYIIPGKRMVEMSYTSSRPGLIHKSVTQTYGPYKKELIIGANKNYLLGFNRDQETFTFEET